MGVIAPKLSPGEWAKYLRYDGGKYVLVAIPGNGLDLNAEALAELTPEQRSIAMAAHSRLGFSGLTIKMQPVDARQAIEANPTAFELVSEEDEAAMAKAGVPESGWFGYLRARRWRH